jgi:hypothetical protein
MKLNDKLVRVLTTEIMGQFGVYRHDPWWWPVDNGRSYKQWGLSSSQHLTSLQEGPQGAKPTNSFYPAFKGSVGSKDGRYWIVSARPSNFAFPSTSCTALYNVLKLVMGDEREDVLPSVHITDLAKFRGPSDVDEGMKPAMWQRSIRCVRREFEVHHPEAVVMVKQAKAWFEPGCTLNPSGPLWAHLPKEDQDFLFQLNARSLPVTYWNPKFSRVTQSEIAREWRESLGLNLRFGR